jgi:hypothetical protein
MNEKRFVVNGTPKQLGRDEFEQFLDVRVKGCLGMSLVEFKAALDAGTLDPEEPHVASMAILVGARSR